MDLRKASFPQTKRRFKGKHWDNEEVEEEEEEEEKVSFSFEEIYHKAEGGICPKLLDQVFIQCGATTEESWDPMQTFVLWLLRTAEEFHWSAQEMRTGVWESSLFWLSAKPLWPLKQDSKRDWRVCFIF